MSISLSSLKGLCKGSIVGITKGETRSLDSCSIGYGTLSDYSITTADHWEANEKHMNWNVGLRGAGRCRVYVL